MSLFLHGFKKIKLCKIEAVYKLKLKEEFTVNGKIINSLSLFKKRFKRKKTFHRIALRQQKAEDFAVRLTSK